MSQAVSPLYHTRDHHRRGQTRGATRSPDTQKKHPREKTAEGLVSKMSRQSHD
eukprot:gene17187-18917_t